MGVLKVLNVRPNSYQNTNYVTHLQSYSVVVKIDPYLLFKDRNLPFSETQRADLIHGMKISREKSIEAKAYNRIPARTDFTSEMNKNLPLVLVIIICL